MLRTSTVDQKIEKCCGALVDKEAPARVALGASSAPSWWAHSCMHVMGSPTQSPHTPPLTPQQGAEAPLCPPALRISLSFKNGKTKTLERFLTARIRFETPDAERAELYKVFQRFDTDGDGNLTVEEIRDSLEKLGLLISAADLASVLSSNADNPDHTDNGHLEEAPVENGYVDFEGFYNLYRSLCQEENEEGFVSTPNGRVMEADLRSAFDLFDKNHDNFISVTELQSVLLSLGFREANDLSECKSMISSVDSDGDGMVNFDEFKAMMRKMKEY